MHFELQVHCFYMAGIIVFDFCENGFAHLGTRFSQQYVPFALKTRKSNQRLQTLPELVLCGLVWCILCGVCVLLCYIIRTATL